MGDVNSEALINTIHQSLAEVETETLVDSLRDVGSEASPDTLSESLAKVKAEKVGQTLTDVKKASLF